MGSRTTPAMWDAMRWLRAHPAIAFVGLTIAWSWSVWSLLFVIVGRGGLLRDPPGIAIGIAASGAWGRRWPR